MIYISSMHAMYIHVLLFSIVVSLYTCIALVVGIYEDLFTRSKVLFPEAGARGKYYFLRVNKSSYLRTTWTMFTLFIIPNRHWMLATA